MASRMASNLYGFWQARNAPTYTRMPTQDQEHESNPTKLSFESSLHRLDEYRLTSWPNFGVEGNYKSQRDDEHSIRSGTSSTIEIFHTQPPIQRSTGFFRRCKLMYTRFPYRDMSYLVGVSFTIGSAMFITNGFFLLLPLIAPATNFSTETPYATPASSVIGELIFLIGSWVAVLEALNLGRGDSVITEGIPLDSSIRSRSKKLDIEPAVKKIRDSSTDSRTPESPRDLASATITTTIQSNNVQGNTSSSTALQSTLAMLGSPAFIYYPTSQQLTTTYMHSILFNSSIIQLIGAVIFGIATITSVPNVIPPTNTALLQYLNLLPATLGGLLFLIASLLQILNSQTRAWWKPEFWKWDWHVGFWNSIGSLGFLLAGLLPWIANGAAWGAIWGTMADFLGSWAFFFGGLVQWWGVMGGYC